MGNLPNWLGASEVYSKAYEVLNYQVFSIGDRNELIEALNKGDEEKIKGLMLLFREYYPDCFK